jgi:hypothetical protein
LSRSVSCAPRSGSTTPGERSPPSGARTDPEACRRDRGGLAEFIKLDRELMSQLDAITKVIATERDGQLSLPETP